MNDLGVSRRKKRNLKRPIESESSENGDIVPELVEREQKRGLNKFFTKSESSQSQQMLDQTNKAILDAKNKKLPFKKGKKIVKKMRMFEDDKGYTQVEEYESYEDITEAEAQANAEKNKQMSEKKK